MIDDQEHMQFNSEHGIESQKSASEQLEKIGQKLESSPESTHEASETKTEKARAEAFETAISVESASKEKEVPKDNTKISRRGPIGKKQLDKSYKQTMKQVQNELPKGTRTFSKVIHSKSVETASTFIGATIARPNAILAGSIAAFVLTLLVYTVSKTVGYTMSGFETIGAFIIGWIIGIIYDYFKILITGKRY